ncbi:hypothetical protein C2G38_2176997 [Gigaspora rosea]|uniref:Uncharacterized protein n=1 Tax=Gigaspora rosea TaxID=44941 RepID=A0A397VHJ0_9GLOM|nr:hypothetical protein C2G38_2176997 [Gigaspora rosea]
MHFQSKKIHQKKIMSELERLKSENISVPVVGEDSEKNISKFRSEESSKIDTEVISKIDDETLINENSEDNKDNILQPIDTENQFQEIKNVIPIKSHNITIGRSEKLAIITLDASIVNDKYQTTPIKLLFLP